jgi:hypothetical protein
MRRFLWNVILPAAGVALVLYGVFVIARVR